MLSKEAIEDLKIDCTFEEIKKIELGLKQIEDGEVVSGENVRSYIDNELFGKYKINA